MGQRILHLSNSADTSNYIYDTVVVGANSTVRLNGTQYTFSGGTVVKMVVNSVEVGNSNVYLSGFLTTFMFPSYIGNPGSSYNIDEIATYIATEHYNRVIADGGVIQVGINQLKTAVTTLITIYNITDGVISNEPSVKNIQLTNIRNNLNSTIPIFIDPHYVGYKLGAGSGTTLGQATQTLYSLAGVNADVVQTTAASQPLLLAHTGENYWFGSGVNGNFISTPNAVANQITGDIDLIAFINMNTSTYRNILTKDDNVSNRQFIFSINNTLQLALNFGAGLVLYNSTINIPSGANVWIRATRNATNGEIRFFTSNDASTTNPQSVTWTQLGATVSGSTGSTINGNSVLCVGAQSSSGVNAVLGRIFRATISNSIGGTPVVDFNPASYNPSLSQTQWSSATGEVWTINTGTATTGYKGVLVDRTIVQGDGVDDFLLSGTLATRQYFTSYLASNPLTISTSTDAFYGSTNSNHVLYEDSGIVGAYNLATLNYSGALSNRLALYTTNFNSASSLGLINNTNQVNGSTGAGTSTNIQLFLYSTGLYFGNNIINTLIQSVAVDNSTQRTAMYNFIRLINNNAF